MRLPSDNSHYVNLGVGKAGIGNRHKGYSMSRVGYHECEGKPAPKIVRFAYGIGIHTYVLPGQTGRPGGGYGHGYTLGLWRRIPPTQHGPKKPISDLVKNEKSDY